MSRGITTNRAILWDADGGQLPVVYKVSATGVQHPRRLRSRYVKTTVRKRAVIARRHEQVSSPFAAVGAGEANVDDPLKPHVVDGADPHRRLFDHHGTLRQIHDSDIIDSVGVAREQLAEAGLSVRTANRYEQLAQCSGRCCHFVTDLSLGKSVLRPRRLHPCRESREEIVLRKRAEVAASGGWTLWSFEHRKSLDA
jgi:hypothetical protein